MVPPTFIQKVYLPIFHGMISHSTKKNIVCMYTFLASRCQIIPFPFVENALNTSYIYDAK